MRLRHVPLGYQKAHVSSGCPPAHTDQSWTSSIELSIETVSLPISKRTLLRPATMAVAPVLAYSRFRTQKDHVSNRLEALFELAQYDTRRQQLEGPLHGPQKASASSALCEQSLDALRLQALSLPLAQFLISFEAGASLTNQELNSSSFAAMTMTIQRPQAEMNVSSPLDWISLGLQTIFLASK